MSEIKGYILYRIFYRSGIAYLGRTKQLLQDRIRGHIFKRPMHRDIDINLVTKIEYAEFDTEADMNVYEIYFINKWKPPLNKDDKARDDLSFDLPNVEWKLFITQLWSKWKDKVSADIAEEQKQRAMKIEFDNQCKIMRDKWRGGEIARDEYYAFKEGEKNEPN